MGVGAQEALERRALQSGWWCSVSVHAIPFGRSSEQTSIGSIVRLDPSIILAGANGSSRHGGQAERKAKEGKKRVSSVGGQSSKQKEGGGSTGRR